MTRPVWLCGVVIVAACGGGGGGGASTGSGSGSAPPPAAARATATGSAGSGSAAPTDPELAALTAFADTMCACTTEKCSDAANNALMDWERPHAAFTQTRAGQAQLHRLDACSDALDQRTGLASAPATQVSMGDDPAPPPAGLSPQQLATVDAKIAELQKIGAAVAASADCAAAAQVIRAHATGFVSLKAVMRAANPGADPKIDTYFEQVELPRALGAISPILNRACDTPEWSAAMDAQDLLGLKTVR